MALRVGLSESARVARRSPWLVPRLARWWLATVVIGTPSTLRAQGADSAEAPAPRVQVGVASGSLSLGDGRTSSGVITLVAVHPSRWSTISVSPAVEHLNATLVRSSSGTNAATGSAATGLADLPISLAAEHRWSARPWRPSVDATLATLLPTGSTAQGIGIGSSVSSLAIGAGVQPVEPIGINVSLMHDLSGYSGADRSLAMQADLNGSLGDHATVDLGGSRDLVVVGGARYASVSLGGAWQFAHGVSLGADWSRSVIASGAARQVLQGGSVGVGLVVPSFVPSNGNPALARGRSGAAGRQGATRNKARVKTKKRAAAGG